MPLSRKHFERAASIFRDHAHALNDAGDNGGADTWISLRDSFADWFAGDNELFDRDRFNRACDPRGKADRET